MSSTSIGRMLSLTEAATLKVHAIAVPGTGTGPGRAKESEIIADRTTKNRILENEADNIILDEGLKTRQSYPFICGALSAKICLHVAYMYDVSSLGEMRFLEGVH